MTNPGLADQQERLSDESGHVSRATVLKLFVVIAAVSFILRIFYAGHLYEDDGLWFTAAEEMVRGKALYREIYFDKPPGLALVYALLFWFFGAHIIVIRLFTIAYAIAISAVLYLFGSRLYDKRVGLLAAGLFAVFSTTYATGHVQGLGTDLLMSLPYAAGAYLLVRARLDLARQSWLAVTGGFLVGVAIQTNPKGIFDLIFFAVLLIVSRRWAPKGSTAEGDAESTDLDRSMSIRQSSLRSFALATAGVVAGSAPFLSYIVATGSLREYWLYVWVWGARYGSYYGVRATALKGLIRSADYFTLNNTLFIALIFLAVLTLRRLRRGLAIDGTEQAKVQFDLILLIWLAVSYVGVTAGGRFFHHYFIQLLPSLCLIGARGLTGILSILRGRSLSFRRSAIAIIVVGFVFTLVRFHWRGVSLAADLVSGTTSVSNSNWEYIVRNREERMTAAVVRNFPGDPDGVDRLGLESIRADGPRTRAAAGPTDYLFVWGYRPEIYFWSGLFPASRYLSTQPLTGVPADVHYFGDDYHSILDEAATALAREQLLRDLQDTRPKYIVDDLGMFNAHLAMDSYPELKEFMLHYKATGRAGRFMIYCRRDLLNKNLRRRREKER